MQTAKISNLSLNLRCFYSLIADIKSPYFALFWLALISVCYLFLDQKLALHLHQAFTQNFMKIAQSVTELGQGSYVLTVVFGFFLFAKFCKKSPEWARAALFIFFSVLLAGILCDVFKLILGRARPVMWFNDHEYGFYFWQTKASMWSFPSGHATTISSAMLALSLRIPRYWIAFCALLIIVCLSRLIVEAHYLSDILAGIYLGTLSTLYMNKLFYSNSLSRLTTLGELG